MFMDKQSCSQDVEKWFVVLGQNTQALAALNFIALYMSGCLGSLHVFYPWFTARVSFGEGVQKKRIDQRKIQLPKYWEAPPSHHLILHLVIKISATKSIAMITKMYRCLKLKENRTTLQCNKKEQKS